MGKGKQTSSTGDQRDTQRASGADTPFSGGVGGNGNLRPFVAGTQRTREIARMGSAAALRARQERLNIQEIMESGLEYGIGVIREEIAVIDQRMAAATGRGKGGSKADHRQRAYLGTELAKICARIVPMSVSHCGSVGVHVPQDVPPEVVRALKGAASALQARGVLGSDGLPVIEGECREVPELPMALGSAEGPQS